MSYTQLEIERALVKKGTLSSLVIANFEERSAKFMSEGFGNLKVAKNFNNKIGEILFEIPLDHVRLRRHKCLIITFYYIE